MLPSLMFDNGGHLVREASMLPPVPKRIGRLYADFETSSGSPDADSTDPFFTCSAIGVAVTWDDCKDAWFVPRELMLTGWWADVMRSTDTWVNHHVKYDAHVSKNDLDVAPCSSLECTLTGAKLVDSDKMLTGGYGLDTLCKQWLKRDIDRYYWALQPYLVRNKDYGRIPLDIIAEYACEDVFAVRQLADYLKTSIPEESQDVWSIEKRITHLLYEMEQVGIRVDPTQIKIKQMQVLTRMLELDCELEAMIGRPFKPTSSDDCYDLLCAQYGLPILGYTDTGGASFDKEALQKYLNHPEAPQEIITRIFEYRTLSTFNSLFLETYGRLQRNGIMHPNHNQMVRTGRMSCSNPNMQQLSGLAKELIVPPEGYAIVSADASQLEYRLIAHYIENPETIAAYKQNPWMDYHQLIADRMGTSRKAGKTMNFRLGYGGGRKNAVAAMSIDKAIVGDVIKQVDEMKDLRPESRRSTIAMLCQQRGNAIYDGYHNMLPQLKMTTRQAADVCARRGYARNWYGRRRHIPRDRAHIAFNTLCQSTAGDYIKERQVALRDELPWLQQVTQVHDQVLGYVELDRLQGDKELATLRSIVDIMNVPSRAFKVPFRTTIGWSDRTWKHAQSEEREKKI